MSENNGSLQNQESREKVYTVDEAINAMGFGPFQILITVFCGLLWLADSMELMILTVLSPAVKCQWELSRFEEAMITSVVFFGFFLGGLFWGVLFDFIGRKRGLLLVDLVVLLFGILSAVQISSDDSRLPGYPWLLVCRFGVGLGAGGSSQAITYYAEFLPLKGRGVCIILAELWWALGTMFGAVLALAVLRDGGLGWHWYLGLATIPLILVLLMFPFVPESARFYLVKGKDIKAQKVIKRIAWYNMKEAPSGTLVSHEDKEEMDARESAVLYSQGNVTIVDQSSHNTSQDVNGAQVEENNALQVEHDDSKIVHSKTEAAPLLESDKSDVDGTAPCKRFTIFSEISLLFNDGMWKTTVILLFLWFGSAWLYYGIVLLTTSLLQYNPHCDVETERMLNFSNTSIVCEGNQLSTNDYLKIMWTTGAELPGLIITLVIIERYGRKITLALDFIGCMIGFLLLFICGSDIILILFLFIIRAFASGVFQAVFVYTPEVYPTSARGIGMGVCTSSARLGAMVTPYVAQVLLHANDYATLSLYAGSCLVLAGLAMLLPIETKGRALHDKGKSK